MNKSKTNPNLDTAKTILFLLYFVILSTERIISLVTTFAEGFFSTPYDIYMQVLTIAALIEGWVFLILKGKSLFQLKEPKTKADFLLPSVAAGILLLGGMVHTRGTIPPVQFAAYGCLLGSMAIFNYECAQKRGEKALRWVNYAFITAFSMAIPVVYNQFCGCGMCTAFGVTQIIVSAGLVGCFTYLLYQFYNNDSLNKFDNALTYIMAAAAVGDSLTLFFRWHNEINFFVLVSISLAIILWFVLFALNSGKKNHNENINKNTD